VDFASAITDAVTPSNADLIGGSGFLNTAPLLPLPLRLTKPASTARFNTVAFRHRWDTIEARKREENMKTPQQREERNQKIATSVHMLRSNVTSLRATIVLDRPEMLLEIVNDMEKTLAELSRILT
jgi:hypothetical protein